MTCLGMVFFHVYAVQDFAELFELVILCPLTNVGKFKAIIQNFFFFPVERLEEGDFDFSLNLSALYELSFTINLYF